jgi:hypothetical protein
MAAAVAQLERSFVFKCGIFVALCDHYFETFDLSHPMSSIVGRPSFSATA